MARATRQPVESDTSLQTSLELLNGSVFTGFVADPERPAQRFTVELLLDGLVIRTAYADIYVQDLAEKRIGDGCHGFAFSISRSLIENAVMAGVRVANLGIVVGSPLLLSDLRKEPEKTVSTSRLRWLGGLRFSGWIEEDSQKVFTLS